MENDKITKAVHDSIVEREKLDSYTELEPYGPLLAIVSTKHNLINSLLLNPNVKKRQESILIDEQYFIDEYCSDFGVKNFVGYLLSQDEECLMAFKGLIDFMHAEFKITSEVPCRVLADTNKLMDHHYWLEGITGSEFTLYTEFYLDKFILDYRVGDITLKFNAAELFSYLVEKAQE